MWIKAICISPISKLYFISRPGGVSTWASSKVLICTHSHNYWRNEGTRGPAGRFGHQHIYNNLYEDFLYQAIHSRSDNQVLVEGNVFRGKTVEALSTYGLVIPKDSPNTSPDGDYELDGFANLGASK